MVTDAGTWVRIGIVRRAWGRRGGLRIRVETDWPERRFAPGGRIWIGEPGEEPRPMTVRAFHGGDRLELEGTDSITEAEDLAGLVLYVHRDALDRPEDELRRIDLEGLRVLDARGHGIGWVEAVEEGVAADLLRVRLDEGGRALVPLAPEICPEIDLDQRRVMIDPPDGLLDPRQAETVSPGGEDR